MIRQHLEYIVFLAEEKSITRAAERLGITQSALSQYLLGLEKSLGVPLFNRVRNKTALTYAGEIFLSAARDILEIQKDLVSQINDISASDKGEISLGIGMERGIDVLPRLFPAFNAVFPDITLHVVQDIPPSLEELAQMGYCDIVFLSLYGCGTTLESVCIGQDELLLAVPKGHPLADLLANSTSRSNQSDNNSQIARERGIGRSGYRACTSQNNQDGLDRWPIIDPVLLRKASFVVTTPNALSRQIADAFFQTADIQPAIIFESDSITTVYDTALNIGALCLVPESFVRLRDPQRRHSYFSIDRARYSMLMVVAWRQGAYLSRAAKALIEILRGLL